MNQEIYEKLREMRLPIMAEEYKDQSENTDTLSIPLSEVHAICYRSPHNPLKKSIFFKS